MSREMPQSKTSASAPHAPSREATAPAGAGQVPAAALRRAGGLLRPADVLLLQRTIGNRAVSRLLGRVMAEGREGYRAIANAAAEGGAQFYGHAEVAYPALGFTTKVADHESPDIDYRAEHREEGWFARPQVDAESDEGTNASWALAAGTHRVPGEQIEGKPVDVVVSAGMAAEILAAEDEHNDDFRSAAERILDRADDWLDENMEDSYGPAPTQQGVEDMVDEDLNAGLQPHLGLTGVEDFEWPNLHAYYARASAQTDKRDEAGWHTFDNEEHEEEDRVRVVISDENTQIGQHASADVVVLAEVT